MAYKKPHIVLLGDTGFAGAALAKSFEKKGCLVSGFNSSTLNLCDDKSHKLLQNTLGKDSILIITSRSRAPQSLEQFKQNMKIAQNIAEILHEQIIAKCIYFSSLSVYSDTTTNLNISEDTPINPSSLYGLGKFSAESLLNRVSYNLNIPFLSFRPCKVYGPGDHLNSYGPTTFLQSIISKNCVTVYGDGHELRDHLFMQDMVKVVTSMALGDHCGVYNMASGESRSFMEIIEIIQNITNQPCKIIYRRRTSPQIDQKINMAKLHIDLPNFNFTPLKNGLQLYYDYLKKQPDSFHAHQTHS